MAFNIINVVPQLPALDFDLAKSYYTRQLDCQLIATYDDLLILSLNGQEFHLWKCADKSIPESSSMYIRVHDIDSLYNKYAGKVPVRVPLTLQPWGMKEFYLMDPSGNLLKFGEQGS